MDDNIKERVNQLGNAWEAIKLNKLGEKTLRDYFAASALQGLISARGAGDFENAAKYAFMAADAMLAIRGKSHK